MSELRKLLSLIDEKQSIVNETVAGCVASVAMPMGETRKRVEEDTPEMPEVLQFGNWQNTALATGEKTKTKRKKKPVAASVYGSVKESKEEKIAGRYTPDEFDDKVKRLKDKAKKNPVDIADLARRMQAAYKKEDEKKLAEGQGNFAKAIENLHGWYQTESGNPEVDLYHFDDGEGGYYADGNVEHNLRTGEIKIDFEDKSGEYGHPDISGTYHSIGDAMNALRQPTTQMRYNSGRKPNFDTLGGRSIAGSNDVYKTDRAGKKGTLTKGRMDQMKMSSPHNMRGGPKGVLPEGQLDELSEEQLLASELKKRLDLFKRGADKDLGKKPSDRGVQKKDVEEAEGEPEGLPHLTKAMLTHIVQQVETEGAHAIVKSLEWGDGAAKELLELITQKLADSIDEVGK